MMLAAVALVIAVAGWRSLTLVALNVIGTCAVLAGAYWFLANRGVLRWLALVLMVAAPVLILVTFALQHLLWVAVVAVALMVAAAGTAKTALSTGQDAAMPSPCQDASSRRSSFPAAECGSEPTAYQYAGTLKPARRSRATTPAPRAWVSP